MTHVVTFGVTVSVDAGGVSGSQGRRLSGRRIHQSTGVNLERICQFSDGGQPGLAAHLEASHGTWCHADGLGKLLLRHCPAGTPVAQTGDGDQYCARSHRQGDGIGRCWCCCHCTHSNCLNVRRLIGVCCPIIRRMQMRRPLSVAHSDPEALGNLLMVHAPPSAHIVDVTFNRGRIWKGLDYHPLRLDIDPQLYAAGITDQVADFRSLPLGAASAGILVFDPPHLTEARNGLAGDASYAARYGTRSLELDSATDITYLFEPFLLEAKRVLVPEGLVIAKIADQVHRGAYRWQARMFQNITERLGFTCCDLVVKVRAAGMTDPKWQHVHHVRKAHSYWLVLRNGSHCTRRSERRAA
jgi:hypothetical protein